MKGYLRKDVAAITGIKPYVIQQYTDKELVIPSVENPGGRGTNRRYSKHDMVELLICRELVEAGIKHDALVDVLAIVRQLRHGKNKWEHFLVQDNVNRDAIYLVVADYGLESLRVGISSKIIDAFDNPHIVDVDMKGKSRAVIVDLKKIFNKVIAGIK